MEKTINAQPNIRDTGVGVGPGKEKTVLKYNAAIIDTSNIAEAQARDIAAAKMTRSKEDSQKHGVVRKTFDNIFKYGILAEMNKQREYYKAKNEIINKQNLMEGEGEFDKKNTNLTKANSDANYAIMEKFMSEYENDTLTNEERASKNSNNNSPVGAETKALIREFAGANMTKEVFESRKREILKKYNKDETIHADNLFEIANHVKESMSHYGGLQNLDIDIQTTFGKAQDRLKTGPHYNLFDKCVNKIRNLSIGKYNIGGVLMSEPVVIGLALATGGLAKVGQMAASGYAKLAMLGGGSVIAGAVSAIKEGGRITEDRAQNAREEAKGMTVDGQKRKEFEKTSYNTRGANEFINSFDNVLSKINHRTPDGRPDPIYTPEEINNVLPILVEAEARHRLQNMQGKNIDLITYSSFDKVQKEGKDLDVKRGELKAHLTRMGLNMAQFEQQVNDMQGELDKDVLFKNKEFKKLKTKKIAGAFMKSALSSFIIGGTLSLGINAGVQEYNAWHNPKFDGLTEKLFHHGEGGNAHATPLEAARRYIMGDKIEMPYGHGVENNIANNLHVHTPDGSSLVPDGHGHYVLMANGKVLADNLNIDPTSGHMDQATMDALAAKGVSMSQVATTGSPEQIINQTPAEYSKAHPGLFKEFHPKGWYDNNTSAFDRNEQKLWWGGPNNSGIVNGHYVFNVSHMSQDGSFHGGLTSDQLKLAAEGKLHIGISMTDGEVIPVQVGTDGNAIIPKEAEFMFKTVNGHADFLGDKVQVIDDKDFVSATFLGNHSLDTIQTTVPGDLVNHIKLNIPDETMWFTSNLIPGPGYRKPMDRLYHESKDIKQNITPVGITGKRPQQPVRDIESANANDGLIAARIQKENNQTKIPNDETIKSQKWDDGNMAPIESPRMDDGNMAYIDNSDKIPTGGFKSDPKWDDGNMAPIDENKINTNENEHWYSIGAPGRRLGNPNQGVATRQEINPKQHIISEYTIPEPRRLEQFYRDESKREYFIKKEMNDYPQTRDEMIAFMTTLKFDPNTNTYSQNGREVPADKARFIISEVLKNANQEQSGTSPQTLYINELNEKKDTAVQQEEISEAKKLGDYIFSLVKTENGYEDKNGVVLSREQHDSLMRRYVDLQNGKQPSSVMENTMTRPINTIYSGTEINNETVEGLQNQLYQIKLIDGKYTNTVNNKIYTLEEYFTLANQLSNLISAQNNYKNRQL